MPDFDALNYPYIRVRSVDWLKRTLLIFPHVVRMTPDSNAPADDPEVSEFCWTSGRRGPLLRAAKLWEPHVEKAQAALIRGLDELRQTHGDQFIERFKQGNTLERDRGEAATSLSVWERRLTENPSFQIHRYKMDHALVSYLLREKLAWEPTADYSDGSNYLEMNPRLGEAVMATLAMACAENEGLRVVTEFPKLHGQMIGTPRDAILKACLEEPGSSGHTSDQQIAEFLVYRRCNVNALTAERIAALKDERDALADFREAMEKLAATLPPTIYSESALKERLDDQVSDIFLKWKRDQANLSSFARKLFGEGALDEPAKLAEELVKSAVTPEGATAITVGAHLGGLTLNIAAGAAAGFVVAVAFRAARVWGKTTETARESPFRYLTALQKQGVSFKLVANNSERITART